MKISELIKELADCLMRYGDIEVEVRNEAEDLSDAQTIATHKGTGPRAGRVYLEISADD